MYISVITLLVILLNNMGQIITVHLTIGSKLHFSSDLFDYMCGHTICINGDEYEIKESPKEVSNLLNQNENGGKYSD